MRALGHAGEMAFFFSILSFVFLRPYGLRAAYGRLEGWRGTLSSILCGPEPMRLSLTLARLAHVAPNARFLHILRPYYRVQTPQDATPHTTLTLVLFLRCSSPQSLVLNKWVEKTHLILSDSSMSHQGSYVLRSVASAMLKPDLA